MRSQGLRVPVLKSHMISREEEVPPENPQQINREATQTSEMKGAP